MVCTCSNADSLGTHNWFSAYHVPRSSVLCEDSISDRRSRVRSASDRYFQVPDMSFLGMCATQGHERSLGKGSGEGGHAHLEAAAVVGPEHRGHQVRQRVVAEVRRHVSDPQPLPRPQRLPHSTRPACRAAVPQRLHPSRTDLEPISQFTRCAGGKRGSLAHVSIPSQPLSESSHRERQARTLFECHDLLMRMNRGVLIEKC